MNDKKTKKVSYYSRKSNGLINWMDLRSQKYRLVYWLMFAILFFLTLVCIVPIVWVTLSGFKTTEEMFALPPTLFPSKIDLSQAVSAWNKVKMFDGLKNTFIITFGALCFDVIINGLCGFVLAKIKPKGSAIVNTVIFWSMMLPGMSMVPLYMTYLDFTPLHFNLIGTFWPLWMGAGASAFNVLLFRSAISSIPDSYFESAKIDGCSNLRAFVKIIIPLIKPTIMVIAIFTVMGQWGSYLWPMLVLPNQETIGTKIYRIAFDGYGLTVNLRMLVLMMSMIVPLIMFGLFSKQIMGGLDMSGIKG